MANQRVFQIAFGVFVLQVEKFQHQRIADFFVGGNRITRYGFLTFHQHRLFIFRQCRALVKLRVDLPVKLPNRPAARQRFARVKLARVRIPHPQQPNVMRPRQRKGVLPKCSTGLRRSTAPADDFPITDWRISACSCSTIRRPISQYVAVIKVLTTRAEARRAMFSSSTTPPNTLS
jgi:hypothetical protein